MATFRFSARAETDLHSIAKFTQDKWGEKQAKKYVRELRECCALVAMTPAIGRISAQGRWTVRRMEKESHVIFYRETAEGILVQRILHKGMIPKL